MNRVVISVGSNIAPQKNVSEAKKILKQRFCLLKSSRFVRTAPIGYKKQPDFLNGAVLIESPLPIDSVRKELKDIERRLGRVKTENKFGPRTIDLDISVWNGKLVDEAVVQRAFLREAVKELLPLISLD